MHSFTYLLSNLIGIIVSIFFFCKFKNKWKDLFISGIFVGIMSLITAYLFWTFDWWLPLNLMGNFVGFEDFLLGFSVGASVVGWNLWLFPFKGIKKDSHNYKVILMYGGLFFLLNTFFFYYLNFHSFYAAVYTLLLMFIIASITNKESFFKNIFFGLIFGATMIPIYFFIFYFDPLWFINTWSYILPLEIYLFNFIPIEEIIFWAMFGVTFRSVYSLYKSNKNNSSLKKLSS